MADSLNPAQLEAVHHLSGPCLVLAGAGSGKTRVITHKIARLLQAGLAPKEIAAITFTNKAAQEMRERSKALVGPRAAKDLVVATFHSLGVRILRSDGTKVGLKEQFSILDADDVMGVLRDAGGATDNKLARSWQWTISLWKNMGHDSASAATIAKDADEQVAARVMKLYEERLAAYQAVDFDDLIGLPLKLLQRDVEARTKWQAMFGHVLVDEYQDTNSVQYELLKMLVSGDDPRRRGSSPLTSIFSSSYCTALVSWYSSTSTWPNMACHLVRASSSRCSSFSGRPIRSSKSTAWKACRRSS